jgi:NAD(P)-dependent dehydrogenase (short-subunit alcohol dehydrogenase family)
MEEQAGRRAVVTGATSGIGEAIARSLAAAGWTVVIAGRSSARLSQARDRISAAVPGADLRPERADLSLPGEVRELAGRLAREPLPGIVISNAAVIAPLDDITPEGFHRSLAVNHLAPYVLLRLLADAIGARPARFVVVGASPAALARVPADLADLNARNARALGPLPFARAFAAYGRTKNMNAMFGYALARRLAGTRITVNGAHPGIIWGTGLGRGAGGAMRIIGSTLNLFMPGPDAGADTPAWLATSPEVDGITGRFFVKRRQVTTAAHTTDIARCDQLWDESARLTGLPESM